jgi:hypothetical protein
MFFNKVSGVFTAESANICKIATNEIVGKTSTNSLILAGLTITNGDLLQPESVDQNTWYGHNALNGGSGVNNTAFGYNALQVNNNGESNVAVGTGALKNNVSITGSVAVGAFALQNLTTGPGNTGLGTAALLLTVAGMDNTATGNSTMSGNITGSYNVAMGNNALVTSTNSTNTTAIGYQTLMSLPSGTNNTVVGAGTDASVPVSFTSVLGVGHTIAHDSVIMLGNGGTSIAANSLHLDGVTTPIVGAPILTTAAYFSMYINGQEVQVPCFVV